MPGMLLDSQLISSTDIPKDIENTGVVGEQTLLFSPLRILDRRTSKDIDNNGLLARILKNSEIDISLKTLGNAFFPKIVTVDTSPTLLIAPNRIPKGYILFNANSSSTSSISTNTLFAPATVLPIGTTNSSAVNVAGVMGSRFFVDVTVGSAGPVSFNLQTQDPISGNWATAQSDIFQFGAGAVAVGTYYAHVGDIGVDSSMRIQAVVAGGALTCSLSAYLKPATSGLVTGASVFIGGPDVNTSGYPIISGTKETFYIKENTAIYAVAAAALTINVFELT